MTFWSPRANHSVEVSELYRNGLRLPYLPINATVFHWINLTLITLTFGIYAIALRTFKPGASLRALWIISGVLLVVLVVTPPFYATDIFYYADSGRLFGVYRQNPYLIPPSTFSQGDLTHFDYWSKTVTNYGPVWTLISGLLILIAGGTPFAATLVFKLLGAVSVAASALLIRTILRELRPDFADFGAFLFLWNPAVLLEGVANAHNDILMVPLLLVSILLLIKKRPVWGFIPLVLATLIKYLPAPLAGFYVLVRLHPQGTNLRKRLVTVLWLILVGIALTILAWMPFWAGAQTLSSLYRRLTGQFMAGPIPSLVVFIGGFFHASDSTLGKAAIVIFLLLFYGAFAWGVIHIVKMWRKQASYSFMDEITAMGTIMAIIPILMPGSFPWFMLPAMGLFAVAAPNSKRRAWFVYIFVAVWSFYRAVVW